MKGRILIVDDEDTIRKLLTGRLDREGYETKAVASVAEAEQELTRTPYAVIVTDLKMPGKDGFEMMKWAREKCPETKLIVITGHGEKDAAVASLKNGAADYIEKPFDLDEFSHAIRRTMKEYATTQENKDLVSRLEARVERVEGKTEDKYWFVSKSSSMEKVNEWLNVLRRESLRGEAEEPSVLILGESGTGKEGVARMVHAGSRRARGPWVAVNCANFNEQLLESELFGHEKGAFTGATNLKRGLFEIAKNGTLFLDEIGEMDIKLQAKLLRVLQEKVFRRVGGTQDFSSEVRVVAATNRDLQSRVTEGRFREDLYHRLSRVVMELPGLRARTEDLVPMAKEFAYRAFSARGKTFGGFTPDAEETIKAYTWPGNVRELLNVVERVALVWSGDGPVGAKTLGLPTVSSGAMPTTGGRHLELVKNPLDAQQTENGVTISYTDLKKRWVDSFELEYLTAILNRHRGNVSAAARDAKLDRSNFLRLLRRHNLRAQEYRKVA